MNGPRKFGERFAFAKTTQIQALRHNKRPY